MQWQKKKLNCKKINSNEIIALANSDKTPNEVLDIYKKHKVRRENYSFTNNMTYINPALQLLQDWGFVDTFREQPKQSTKFNIVEANETVQKFSKKTRLSPVDQQRYDRAKKILSKKNEDTHSLYVFLTKTKQVSNHKIQNL